MHSTQKPINVCEASSRFHYRLQRTKGSPILSCLKTLGRYFDTGYGHSDVIIERPVKSCQPKTYSLPNDFGRWWAIYGCCLFAGLPVINDIDSMLAPRSTSIRRCPAPTIRRTRPAFRCGRVSAEHEQHAELETGVHVRSLWQSFPPLLTLRRRLYGSS